MVLDHEPKPVSQDVSIRIPSPNSGAFTSKIVPVAPAAKSAPEPSVKPEVTAPAQAPAPPPAKSDAPKAARACREAGQSDGTAGKRYRGGATPESRAPAKATKPAAKPVAAEKAATRGKSEARHQGRCGLRRAGRGAQRSGQSEADARPDRGDRRQGVYRGGADGQGQRDARACGPVRVARRRRQARATS